MKLQFILPVWILTVGWCCLASANERYCGYLELSGLKGKRVTIQTVDDHESNRLQGTVVEIEPAALVLSLGQPSKGIYDDRGRISQPGPYAYVNCNHIFSVIVDERPSP